MKRFKVLLAFSAACLISYQVYAQGKTSIQTVTESLKTKLDKKDASALMKGALGDPELINSVVGLFLDGNNSNFKIKFKTFEEEDQPASLGFDYSLNLDKSSLTVAKNEIDSWGFSGGLKATGNVAFDSKLNPADFLRSEFHIGTFFSSGGVENPKNKAETFDFLNEFDSILAEISDKKELNKIKDSPLWKEFNKRLVLTNQYYLDFSLTAGLESDQRFEQRQWTFGAISNFGLKAWNKSNIAARMNVFDWPFAFIRAVSGVDKSIQPRGSSLPTFMAGLDLVNPVSDSVRQTLTSSLDKFWRFRFEAGYRSLVTEIEGMKIFFNVSYRYFKELNAPTEVITAEKDFYQYFTASLTSSQGFFISYSAGDLPFDRRDDAIYEVGFRYQFPE